jgi:uncharacterized protein YlxW (UPF0749 family)
MSDAFKISALEAVIDQADARIERQEDELAFERNDAQAEAEELTAKVEAMEAALDFIRKEVDGVL